MVSAEELEANWRIAQQEAGAQFARAERAEALCRKWAAVVSDLGLRLGAKAADDIQAVMDHHFPRPAP